MKLKHLILFIFFFKYADVFGQTDSSSFYTHTRDDYTHFYYDEQYYLVDKKCKFRHYTRVIKRSKHKNVFDGFFTDYYNNDKIALTGTYTNGVKNGIFKNFYYNGTLKFEISFVNDKPEGIAKYYYDNGTPWMTISHKESKVFITDYWDPYGNKKVTDGKGSFEYVDHAWGFNDAGYNSISYSGRLLNGLPRGSWRIFVNYPNSPSELIAIETFQKGEFINSFNFRNSYYPQKASNLMFFPAFVDSRSQKFISKRCGIDDNQDYTLYLENFLNRNFDFSIVSADKAITPFICEVNISATGHSLSINIIEGETTRTNRYLQTLLGLIPYWIPSFKDGKTISDKLIIKFYLNNTEAENRFKNFSVSREVESQN